MATFSSSSMAASLLLVLVTLLPCLRFTEAQVGVCYGMNGNNLPSKQDTVNLYKSNNIRKMRLYSPDKATLQALKGSNIELILTISNDKLQSFGSDASQANQYVQTNIVPFASNVNFKYIAVGNEVEPSDTATANAVLPAMQNILKALQAANLNKIKVTLAVKSSLLTNTFPPSKSVFGDLKYMTPIINFLKSNGSPLLMNIYPYFSYHDNPSQIDINYALFNNGPTVTDTGNGLKYHNLFDALVDSFVAAIEKVGAPNLGIVVSESGWPDQGASDATTRNAALYYKNLVAHVKQGGTPKRPGSLDTYLFAMYDENLLTCKNASKPIVAANLKDPFTSEAQLPITDLIFRIFTRSTELSQHFNDPKKPNQVSV